MSETAAVQGPVPAAADAAQSGLSAPGGPICHRCHEQIHSQFYKVGDYAFHRDHFNCCVCEKLLLDSNDFRLKDGDFYCLQHYEERFTHICPGCQQKIVAGSGKVIKALGFYYHENCFVCTTCKKQLSGKFFSANGKPFCSEHAKQPPPTEDPSKKPATPTTPVGRPPRRPPSHAPAIPSGGAGYHAPHSNSVTSMDQFTGETCQLCSKPLATDRVSMWGKNYHKHCLECKYCHKNLAGRSGEKVFFVKEGDAQVIVCERDYKIMCTKWCNACGDSIVGEMVYINKGEYYHQDCFKCKQCSKKLDTYLCIAGELRCSDHTSASNADVTCASCKQEIELSKFYPAVGKKYHKHCLKCNFCSRELEASDCKLRDGQLSCNNCLLEASLAQDHQSPTISSSPASATPDTRLSRPDVIEDRSRSRSVDARSRPAPKLASKNSGDRKNKVLPSPGAQKKPFPEISENEDLKLADEGHESLKESNDSGKSRPSPPSTMALDSEPDVEKPDTEFTRSRTDSGGTKSAASHDLEEKVDSLHITSPPHVRNKSDGGSGSSSTTSSLANTTTGFSLNSPRPGGLGRTMTPRKISNWKKGEMIGRGQFGKVYVGLLETGQWIAVKQMDIKNEEDEQHVKNMEKEVQLMEKLRHENIVSLLGTQRDGQHFYILMEYVAGKSLDVLLKNFGPFPEVTIKWYTLQLVRALEFMHTHNIIHRDIKGKNILVDTNGNLKIADFGSAKQVDNFKKDTPTLSYNYTPLWTAPEVVTSGNYDRKVDIWALGCVIIEMGSAKLPWSECKFENPFQILFHIGNATSHPELPNELSETCKDFIKKCLTRDPDERPDASELLNHPFLNEMDGEEIPVDIEDL